METSNLIVAILVLQIVFADESVCASRPSGRSYDTRAIVKENGVIYETVRYGHYIELDCCSNSSGDFVTDWMKWSKSANQWEIYVPNRWDISFHDKNQILSIQSSVFDDAGLYRCSVRNGSIVTMISEYRLEIVACDKLARGPYAVSPLPCQETISHEKDILTLPCAGYFGCAEDGDIRIVTWFVSSDKSGKDDWEEVTSVDKRYKKVDFQSDGGAVIGTNFTINGVSEVDFNRKFMCLLASPQVVKGQSRLFVSLKKDSPPLYTASLTNVETILVIGIVAVVLLGLNIVILILVIYRRVKRPIRTIKRTPEQELMPMTQGAA